MLHRKLQKYDIILASASPRRKQLLAELEIPFRVLTREVDETFPSGLTPSETAVYLSALKAGAFPKSEIDANTLIITADTIVTLNGEILGKPADRDEAVAMLKKLSGKEHQVITGVTIKTASRQHSFSVSTDVSFRKLSKSEIDFYVDRFEPFDKAGAYGIQEWIGHAAIDSIRGSYFNVMGLPTHRLYLELLNF